MSLETEAVLDRRRLRRKLGIWRSLAIIAVVAVLAAIAAFTADDGALIGKSQIARVTISGVISEDRRQLKMLRKIAKADHVKGVILAINSPGGTTTGAEALFEGIRALAQNKPVVAQFGTVAASAAYITGLACDYIVARSNTITGSVGVIMQWPELSGLLDKIGVKINEIKSGPLKAEPSPFKPIPPEAREISQEMIAEGQRWFIRLVEQRRNIKVDNVPGLRKGRVYLGRAALKYKLIDELGGEQKAIEWMVQRRQVAAGTKVVDWKPENTLEWNFAGATAAFFSDVIIATAREVGKSTTADGQVGALTLDGLVSMWKPGKN